MLKSFLTKWPFLFKIRLFFGFILLVLILIFLYFKIVPFGHITYSRTWPTGLKSGKGFIYDFKPVERIDLTDSQALRIIADPVYFSLFTPRRFASAVVTVKYRDHLSAKTPLVELGVLKDKLTNSYELYPLQNEILDHWRFTWPRLEDSDSRLILQANKNYSSVEKFLSDLKNNNLKDCPAGPASCVAIYNYPLALSYRLPDYAPLTSLVISQPLRGAHQFYLYLQNQPWRLSFDFTDLNQDKGQDPITVNVYSGQEIIATKSLADNNPQPDNGQAENKTLVLSGTAPTAGVYRVEIKASDDIVIAKIVSSSNKLAFINKLWPVSGSGALNIFTDAAYLQVRTFNPASLGKLSFGEKQFAFDKTYQPFYFVAAEGVKSIKLEKDDIILENNGVFAFSETSLFNPGVKKVDSFFNPGDKIKYIIADYARPILEGGVKTATAEINLADAYRENGKYTFLFSLPGLNGQPGAAEYLEIKEISINLSGKTLWQKIFR
jgi:hypothetical protein